MAEPDMAAAVAEAKRQITQGLHELEQQVAALDVLHHALARPHRCWPSRTFGMVSVGLTLLLLAVWSGTASEREQYRQEMKRLREVVAHGQERQLASQESRFQAWLAERTRTVPTCPPCPPCAEANPYAPKR